MWYDDSMKTLITHVNCCQNLEESAKIQWDNCREHPAYRKAALFPDAHMGYDAPIGSVFALKDWVVPSWVGYDIGCGMSACQINIKHKDIQDHLLEIHQEIHNQVPCGDSSHPQPIHTYDINRQTEGIQDSFSKRKVFEQLGTLGGGNHFIELDKDIDDYIWIVVHSGSRGFGHGIGTYWMRKQKDESSGIGWYVKSREAQSYLYDVSVCLDYAERNRKLIADLVKSAITTVLYRHQNTIHIYDVMTIDTVHNDVQFIQNDDLNLYVHRKGAARLFESKLGIIAGNMKDGNCIVEGMGNQDYLYSCSHGAGRKMSRTKAKETIIFAEFEEKMKGIVADVCASTLDESPQAYKDLFDVVKIQEKNKIIKCHKWLTSLLNVKGK